MHCFVRKESYDSVTIYWLDREGARQAFREASERLVQVCPEVYAVYLFGSLARNEATPRSDADLLVLLRHSERPIWKDRYLDYTPYFERVGMPFDLFCYTLEEVPSVPLARSALREAVLLAGQPYLLEEAQQR
ncbi:MAG: nucleotidyltransferase domain-containing protein [Fimbriimonadales bacterium]